MAVGAFRPEVTGVIEKEPLEGGEPELLPPPQAKNRDSAKKTSRAFKGPPDEVPP
jgi:hypothetical protein